MYKAIKLIVLIMVAVLIIAAVLYFVFSAKKDSKTELPAKTEQTEQQEQAGSGGSGSQGAQQGGEAQGGTQQQTGSEAQSGEQQGGEEAQSGEGEGESGEQSAEVTSSRPQTQMLSAAIEGETEGFAADLYCGVLEDGGAKLPYSVYYDKELFTPAQASGRFENEYGAVMEFAFHSGLSKDEVSPSAAESYIRFTEIEFLENESFAGRTANIVRALSGSEYCEVCVFDCEGGCVSAAMLCSLEAREGMLKRMEAMAASFEVEK